MSSVPEKDKRNQKEIYVSLNTTPETPHQSGAGYDLTHLLARAEPLDINCIDFPSAMPQDALPLMDAESRRYYTNLKPLPLDQVRPARAHLAVLDGHYEPFIRQTVDIGMVHVWYQHELKQFERHVENGLFTLHKAGKEVGAARSQRVILAARPGNGHVEIPPNPQIPDRGSLGDIILDRGDDWAIGSTDLSVYFYTLRLPKMLEGLQVLPPLTVTATAPIAGNHGTLYPTLCVAAMGGSHSSTIAQAVHRPLWQVPSPSPTHRAPAPNEAAPRGASAR